MKTLAPDIYIVDGNITLFLGSHSEQFKEDVLHSSLLASLLADDTSKTWLSSYTTNLGRIFWELNKIGNSSHPKATTSLLKIATNSLSTKLQEKQLQQLKKALYTVMQLPSESPASNALLRRLQKEKPTVFDEPPTFILSTLLTIVCENKKIISLQISLESSEEIDMTFLEQPIHETLILEDIETSLWVTCLLEDKYAPIRNQIVKKLGSKPQTHLIKVLEPDTAN